MKSVLMSLVVAVLMVSQTQACPPVAVPSAAASSLPVVAPSGLAVAAPASVGLSYALTSSVASLPVTVAQPVAIAAAPVSAVQLVSAASSCQRVGGCGRMIGGRTGLLPRQRVVSRMVVR